MTDMRFGVSAWLASSGAEWRDKVRRLEEMGFDVLHVADHVGFLDPFTAIVAAAAVTERLRFNTFVLNNEFWNPLLLARAAATTDMLTDGRLELGLGAGYARVEFEQAGMRYPSAGERIDRLAAVLPAVRALLAGETVDDETLNLRGAAVGFPAAQQPVPLLVGGNGDRLLTVAAHHADAVGFTGFTPGARQVEANLSHWSWQGLLDRIAFVRVAAGDRFDQLELNVLVQRAELTEDPERSLVEWFQGLEVPAEIVLDSPFLLLGTDTELRAALRRMGDLGITFVSVFEHSAEAIAALR